MIIKVSKDRAILYAEIPALQRDRDELEYSIRKNFYQNCTKKTNQIEEMIIEMIQLEDEIEIPSKQILKQYVDWCTLNNYITLLENITTDTLKI